MNGNGTQDIYLLYYVHKEKQLITNFNFIQLNLNLQWRNDWPIYKQKYVIVNLKFGSISFLRFQFRVIVFPVVLTNLWFCATKSLKENEMIAHSHTRTFHIKTI